MTPSTPSRRHLRRATARHLFGTATAVLAATGTFVAAQARPPAAPCVISGRVTSAGTPLPGVSLKLARARVVVGATSTDPAGAYRLRVEPGDYEVTAELSAFAPFQGHVSLADGTCAATLDVNMTLRSRAPAAAPTVTGPVVEAPSSLRRPARLAAAPAQPGQPAQPRFSALQVLESDTATAAGNGSGVVDEADPAARLLPPGFSAGAATDVVAVSGNAASLDRGQLRDRLDALGRGEFAGPGADAPAGVAGGAFGGQAGAPGGRGGGGPGGFGGRGGRGVLGRGRGGRLQGSTTYTFGGSALDAAPYPLRQSNGASPDYTRQQFGATIGGPLRIPRLYDGARTTFFLNYAGGRSGSLVDQYSTVPTVDMRGGDFSALSSQPLDPMTGLPFPGGRVPATRLDPAALALLQYFPLPNLPGTTQNYRRTTTSDTTSNGLNLRLTHNFSGAAGQRGGGRGGGRFGGGFGGRGGPGGRSGTAVVLNANVQYQRRDADAVNAFPLLGGANRSASLSVPLALNVLRGRAIHNIRFTGTRSSAAARTGFSGAQDVAGAAGITGVSTDPFDWGVPNLSFASVSGLRDLAPNERSDTRLQTDYTFTRPLQRHTLRLGGGFRRDVSDGRTVSDARGSYVFTGLYTSGGGPVARGSGLDFADFLLGLPQQASVQFGPGTVVLRGQAFNLFAQDDWRARSNLTFNLGVRYEAVRPYTEASGRMANLDVAPGFTGAVPVLSGGTGLYSGGFPAALVESDLNNVAPRVGLAWRVNPRTVVRSGYGMSFNNGAYASIARQLVSQPPFAVTNTSLGTAPDPLTLEEAFATVASSTTNNFGVDKHYQLGVIHTWNLDLNRNAGRGWQVGAGYTGTKGAHLDILRAPNRGPEGLRIAGVQPFLWQTSEGGSILHAGTVRVRKQQTRGVAGTASYTFAKSIDNASSIGGGAQVVAQDDRNLDAEWGLSSFDRRHQFDSNLSLELPFGADRPWLNQGGRWAAALADWSVSASFSAQSGSPFTARLLAAAADVARGTNGTLRADYAGGAAAVNQPTLLRFFNTSAFTIPAAGTFGSAGRNTIIGPGQRQLDASLGRDVRLTGNQVLTLRLEASNLLNRVRYGTIDTVVNSPTFGQVVSVRPMRTVQFNARFRF